MKSVSWNKMESGLSIWNWLSWSRIKPALQETTMTRCQRDALCSTCMATSFADPSHRHDIVFASSNAQYRTSLGSDDHPEDSEDAILLSGKHFTFEPPATDPPSKRSTEHSGRCGTIYPHCYLCMSIIFRHLLVFTSGVLPMLYTTLSACRVTHILLAHHQHQTWLVKIISESHAFSKDTLGGFVDYG